MNCLLSIVVCIISYLSAIQLLIFTTTLEGRIKVVKRALYDVRLDDLRLLPDVTITVVAAQSPPQSVTWTE